MFVWNSSTAQDVQQKIKGYLKTAGSILLWQVQAADKLSTAQ
jgi:hypothetical protein